MTPRRAAAYAAGGAAAAVALTIAVTGTWVPHDWPRNVTAVTLINSASLAFAAALIGETRK